MLCTCISIVTTNLLYYVICVYIVVSIFLYAIVSILLLLFTTIYLCIVGKILAECLDDLPNVESIDVSGNSLTDKSLPFLFKSFQKIPNLHHLNLSRSKIDDDTSDALAEFLANPECPLISLVLQNSDIDDFECARFIGCLKTNKNLRELDLGSNLLGSAEIFQGAKSGIQGECHDGDNNTCLFARNLFSSLRFILYYISQLFLFVKIFQTYYFTIINIIAIAIIFFIIVIIHHQGISKRGE